MGGRETDVLIYVHKEQELDDVERRYPAEHYVMIDDKVRILTAIKEAWGRRVTTVFSGRVTTLSTQRPSPPIRPRTSSSSASMRCLMPVCPPA